MLVSVQQDHLCDLCDDTGTMTWQQPVAGPDGAFVLTEMSHPCVNGCSGWCRLPSAEGGNVIDLAGSPGRTVGNVAEVNQSHRTEWFRPAGSSSEHSAMLR